MICECKVEENCATDHVLLQEFGLARSEQRIFGNDDDNRASENEKALNVQDFEWIRVGNLKGHLASRWSQRYGPIRIRIERSLELTQSGMEAGKGRRDVACL